MKYIHARDIQGCTPLHLAHLHQNKQAILFLLSHGGREDVVDKFGLDPKSLGLREAMWKNGIMHNSEHETFYEAEDHPDVKHYKICQRVVEAKCGIINELRPMLVHSEEDTKALTDELRTLFARLVEGTRFQSAKIAIGSVDVVLFVVDGSVPAGRGDRFIVELLAQTETPIVLGLNKIDQRPADTDATHQTYQEIAQAQQCPLVQFSALTEQGLDLLSQQLSDRLDPGPYYYPPDLVTDQPDWPGAEVTCDRDYGDRITVTL